MLPIQDVIPSRDTPHVTLALIGVGAAALVYQIFLSSPERLSLFLAHGLVPASASAWNVFAAQLLQVEFIGGVINLLMLWVFGDNVEDRLGRLRFALLFFGGGGLASLAAIGVDPAARVVLPASAGAVAAVVGAYVALFPRSRVMVLVPLLRDIDLVDVPALVIALGWVALHCLRYAGSLMTPPPLTGAFVIPLVGFAAGTVVAPFLCRRERMEVDWWSPAGK